MHLGCDQAPAKASAALSPDAGPPRSTVTSRFHVSLRAAGRMACGWLPFCKTTENHARRTNARGPGFRKITRCGRVHQAAGNRDPGLAVTDCGSAESTLVGGRNVYDRNQIPSCLNSWLLARNMSSWKVQLAESKGHWWERPCADRFPKEHIGLSAGVRSRCGLSHHFSRRLLVANVHSLFLPPNRIQIFLSPQAPRMTQEKLVLPTFGSGTRA